MQWVLQRLQWLSPSGCCLNHIRGKEQRETCRATSKQRINALHQCWICRKCFPSTSKLQIIHTGQRPFGCEICGKRFHQKSHLRFHCHTHMWSKYHTWQLRDINRPHWRVSEFKYKAGGRFPSSQNTVAIHLKPKDREWHKCYHRCVILIGWTCEKGFQSDCEKESPKSTQNPGGVQHNCFHCFKCFPSASKLQRHEIVHAGRKPFHCPICGKAFRQASHLNTHKRTHWKGTQPSHSTSRRTSENWKWHMKSRKSLQTPMIHYQILKFSVMEWSTLQHMCKIHH